MNKLRNALIGKGFLAVMLLIVALPAAAQNLDPTRWDDTMAGFAEQDRMHPQPEGAILLTGSSSIARWNDQAAKALAPLTVIPRGFGGSVMGDVLHHLDDVALKYKPRAILIYEGDNDTIYHVPEEKIVGQFQEIVAKIHAALPETRIYILSVKPSIARISVWDAAQRVSANIKSIANHDPLVHYVDVANPFLKANGQVMTDIFVEDNLHLNDMGNLIWGAAIRAALMPIEIRYE